MRHTSIAAALALMLGLLGGCASDQNVSARRNPVLDGEVSTAIAAFKVQDAGMETFFRTAYGYAVFPTVGKGGLIVGGAHGDGQVFEEGAVVGYTELAQGTIGAQIGGQTFSEVIFFKDRGALERFKGGKLEFSGNASAVAVRAGASTAADYENGVAVFTMAKGGLMLEASIGGQKFKYMPY
jgi:lipid-binding SYLF domain-containing protein